MKIFILGQKGIPAASGGIEKHVEELAGRLAERGHDVSAYARAYYTPKSMKEYKGVKVVHVPSLRTKHLDAITHMVLATFDLLRRKADVVHVHGIGPALVTPLIKLFKRRSKIVFTFHCQDYFHKKWGRAARFSLRMGERLGCLFADETIAVSQAIRNYAWSAYQCEATYVPNGITPPEPKDADLIRKQFGLEGGDYVLTVARLIPHKNIHLLISAWRELETDMKLVITGAPFHTEGYMDYLKEMAGGDVRIIFTGEQKGDVLRELYSNAYLYAQPSEAEGLSTTILEALSYGCAVLASDILENMEIVQGNGFSFRNNNVQDLRDQLAYLLQVPDKVNSMAGRGREHVLSHYDWDGLIGQVIKVYDRPKQARAKGKLVAEGSRT